MVRDQVRALQRGITQVEFAQLREFRALCG